MTRELREVPWERLVRFHKEICRRAEESFFSLSAGDTNAERWSSLSNYDPENLSGPWKLRKDTVLSQQLLSRMQQEESLELLLGGPCYFAWKKGENGDWYLDWRPVLYREVRAVVSESQIELIPVSGGWDISPLVFQFLDKHQVSTAQPLEDSLAQIFQRVQELQTKGFTACHSVTQTLAAYSVELGEELRKAQEEFPSNKVKVQPTQWILFSPPRAGTSSAYTQYILKDYARLEKALNESPSNIGGLRLLADDENTSSVTDADILPIVPLNDSQLNSVQTVFKAKPVTVISGPPGCGKSQVVLSLLLNAWSQGISVLFASNNNQAVDVVRERLETFEHDIPIAVRAGAKRFNNIEESLRRSLNVISSLESTRGSDELNKLNMRRGELSKKRESRVQFQASELPDRVDQGVGSAITAYANHKQLLVDRDSEELRISSELKMLGYMVPAIGFENGILSPLRSWVSDIDLVRNQINTDAHQRAEFDVTVNESRVTRDQICGLIGLDASTITNWNWLVGTHQAPKLLEAWWGRYKQLFQSPIEDVLQPLIWDSSYERWSGDEQARNWSNKAVTLSRDIRTQCDRFKDVSQAIEKLDAKYSKATSALDQRIGASSIAFSSLFGTWLSDYAQLCSIEVGRFDWLPWSDRSKIEKSLTQSENTLRSVLPVAVWKKLGPINNDSRSSLCEVLELVTRWLEINSQVEAVSADRERFVGAFNDLRDRLRAFSFSNHKIPESNDASSWIHLSDDLDAQAEIANEACKSWLQKKERDSIISQITRLKADFHAISTGAPIKEAWMLGKGGALIQSIDRISVDPRPENVGNARAQIYLEAPIELIEAWIRAALEETKARENERSRDAIPTEAERIQHWIKQRPDHLAIALQPGSGLPNPDHPLYEHLSSCESWQKQWNSFRDGLFIRLSKQAKTELEHAQQMLKEALEMAPVHLRGDDISTYVQSLVSNASASWDSQKLRKAFSQFSPSRIKSDIERLDAELQKISFSAAKLDWQNRVAGDRHLQDCLKYLKTYYQKSRGEIREDGYELFEKVLKAQPVWITTALSGQSIPLKPDLFDLLIIDEATQCTLTNLLPLIYRCKRLVVIGDPEQLPAIGNIGLAAERALAEKYEIADWLSLFGHADNDVYKCGVNCLPRRQADVVMLTEHYRSHPLIIGFSNQYIYRKSLKLRKDPLQAKEVPMGAGVVGVNVSGISQKVKNSWINGHERDAVIKLIRDIRADERGSGISIGVVTPFRGQSDSIQEALQRNNLAADVTVDTVHGYQGDERDIMIFSPVVSRGMNPAAAKWVETPKNLINVAITRARETLFFVADFAECRKQSGVLGQFCKYVEKIDVLRKTSQEELQLFGWILMQGMMPEVHPRVRDIEVDFILRNGGVQLAIEVDGDQHDSQSAQDAARDAFLQGQGYQVFRVKARDVREAPAVVMARLGNALELNVDDWDLSKMDSDANIETTSSTVH
jgi:hypothetical protein